MVGEGEVVEAIEDVVSALTLAAEGGSCAPFVDASIGLPLRAAVLLEAPPPAAPVLPPAGLDESVDVFPPVAPEVLVPLGWPRAPV